MLQTKNNPPTINVVENSLSLDALPDDKDQLLQEVIMICGATTEWGRRGTYYFYHLGYAIAKLKLMYFEKCLICANSNSAMFDILSCERCAKMKASDSKTFFDIVLKATSYKKEYINFLIRAACLYTKFPKLQLTQWNSTDLRKYMSYLCAKVEAEKDFWV